MRNIKKLKELKHSYYKKFIEVEVSRKEINSFFKFCKNISTERLKTFLFSWKPYRYLLAVDNYKFGILQICYLEDLLKLKINKY